MNRRILKAFAVVAVAIGFGLLARAADPVPPAPDNNHQLKIGVVDAGKVYDSIVEFRESMSAIQQQRAAFGNDGSKKAEEIEGLKKQIAQFKEESPQWNAVRSQIEDKSIGLKAQEELWNMQILQLQRSALKSAYRHVVEATEKVAKTNQLNLVIADPDPDLSAGRIEQFGGQQLAQMIASRSVLYSDSKADITQAVIAMADADHAARKQQGK